MDPLIKHRNIVKQLLETYAQLRPSHGDIRLDVLFDEERDRYALMQTGWDQGRRVRGNLIYITLNDNQVIIEYDGIEHGIIEALMASGVAEKDLILAYLPTDEMVAA